MPSPVLLIVDDEPANLAVLGQVLQPRYRVRAATSGERALEAARTAPGPELILLDVMMPQMDGYSVLTRLRAAPATRDIPVIFVTALDDEVNEEHGLILGAVDYIAKPVKPAIVLARVATHLELKWARDRLTDQNAWLEAEVQARTRELEAETASHRRTAARVAGINRVFQQASSCTTEEQLGKVCLAVAETISGSHFGYIGLLNGEGLLDTLAISNPGWDACQVPPGEASLVIRNMPLRGVDRMTLVEQRSRIVNGAGALLAHPDHVPTPPGHPPLTAFLGVPLHQGDRTVGMIGLGNRDGGYSVSDQEDIEALARAFVEALYHKRAELAIARLNQELSQRAAELESANRDLENFSYSVSHDLRAPLRAIDGFIAILSEEQAERLDGEGRRMFGIVAENARKMGSLIDDILTFSRAGRLPLEYLETDMAAMVRDVWLGLAKPAGGRAVELRLGPLPAAVCDPRAIRQVWQNLLDNAIKFTRDRNPAIIEVTAVPDGEWLCYTVQDNGVGFNDAYVGKLFVLFQRLHGMDEFEGTGVGLAIVKRFVQKHGGEVRATGIPDQGARFSFRLPVRPGSPHPQEKPHGPQ
jgi:signal transduction histidine kinase/CheY-like chemotaxis protein